MPEPDGVACLNFYVPAGEYGRAALLAEAERLRCAPDGSDASALMAVVRSHRIGLTDPTQPEVRRRTVGELAACQAMSREGFSRAYARDHS